MEIGRKDESIEDESFKDQEPSKDFDNLDEIKEIGVEEKKLEPIKPTNLLMQMQGVKNFFKARLEPYSITPDIVWYPLMPE